MSWLVSLSYGPALLSVAAFAILVSAHLAGLHAIAGIIRSSRPRGSLKNLTYTGEIVFVLMVMLLLFSLHLATNIGWAVFMHLAGVLESFDNQLFFSFENYTSLGLTRIDVDSQWRMLSPMISFCGVFCLGWTTAVLVNLFSHLYATSDP